MVAKKYILHRGLSWNYQSIFGHGLVLGGKEKDKDRQAAFLTPTNPFGHDPEEDIATHDFTFPQKVPHETRWKDTTNAVHWVRLSKAQDQGLEFWQTMTCATIPDCTDRFACQEGDRVLFERLEMSRPAPKATIKMNCHSKQQQQHSTSHTHVLGTWKQDVKRESQASAPRRYGPLHRSRSCHKETWAEFFKHGCGHSCQHAGTLERRD